MERREFLQAAGAVAGIGAIGGVLWARAAFARSKLSVSTIVAGLLSTITEGQMVV